MILPRNLRDKSELWQCILSCRRELWSIGFFSAIINLLMLTPSIYMLQVYDRVLPSGNKTTLAMLTVMVLWLFLFIAAVEWLRGFLVIRLGAYLDMSINKRIFLSVFDGFLHQRSALSSHALADLTLLRQFASGSALFAFFDAPWFPVYLLTVFLLHYWLGIIALAGAIILIFLAWLNQRMTSETLTEAAMAASSATQRANTCLQQSDTIAALGMQNTMYQQWLGQHLTFLSYQNSASENSVAISAITRSVRLALQSIMLGTGALLVLKTDITPGMMIAGSILSGRVLAPIDQLIAVWKNWTQAQSAWERLNTLLAECPPAAATMPLPAPEGRLRVDHLTAKPYGIIPSPLHDISFTLEPGDVLGVIGASGSGKSTLARLLVGAQSPLSGKVRLDSADIQQWDKQALGPFIGYLSQDVQLFQGTIAENIARFTTPDEQKIVAAARGAGIHALILSFPFGYDTTISQGGNSLSGGQKQRLALARALYDSPQLLVLDEPDASLDADGKKALNTAILAQKAAGKTQVIITHNTHLIPLTNKLLILQPGKKTLFGLTEHMLQRSPTGAENSGVSPAINTPAARSDAVQNAPGPR